ncbi:glutamate-1-semialdehyde 2,1-aminomutase [Desulfovibrionales bacterium]
MSNSKDLFNRARQVIPGGVNSPVRACQSVGAEPLFIASGRGSRILSVDGHEYIDYVMSWGPLIFGHCHPEIVSAVTAAAATGTSYGAPCATEVKLAEAIVDALPGIEMVRMVNSGTEATMSALRLARAITGCSKLVKFVGCYHGHADPFLAAAGSGSATMSIPGTLGVPSDTVKDTLLAPYNDLAAVEALFVVHGRNIAAIIVEPVAGNMGLVLPIEGFLPGLRALCDKYDTLLIFDEVITGFRVAYGGAQARYGIIPDLTTLGKIIGGGLPVGAYGGRREFMENIAPCGDVYQAGTLSGNPMAMAAGLATLRLLKTADYTGLELRTASLAQGLKDILRDKGVPVTVVQCASMFTIYFTGQHVTNFITAKNSDAADYANFYRQMRSAGVYLAPSGFETAMVSFAHTDADLKQTLDAAQKAIF